MGRKDLFILVASTLVCALSCQRVLSLTLVDGGASRLLVGAHIIDGEQDATKGGASVTSSSLLSCGFGGQAWWVSDEEHFSGFDEGHEYMVAEQFVYYRTVGGQQQWLSTHNMVWPSGHSLNFFFWAPWLDPAGDVLQFPLSRRGNMPRGRFTQKSDPSEQIDLCLSRPALGQDGTEGCIPADFSHALTRLMFYFNVTGTDLTDEQEALRYRIKSLTLEGVVGSNCFTYDIYGDGFVWDDLPRADLSLRDAAYALSVEDATLGTSACPFDWDVESEEGFAKYCHVNSPAEGLLYVLPQPLTHLAKLRILISGYSVSGDVWTEVRPLKEKVVILPEQTVWEAGKTVAYTGTIDVSQWIEAVE